MSNKSKGEEGKPKVPGYIVTFSDMVTLLLTFFVLLLTLANVQDPELFNRGRDSFWESIRYCGLGPLLGKDHSMNLGHMKMTYPTQEPNEASQDRLIDERRERMKRILKRVRESATTLPAQLKANRVNFTVTDIAFARGRSELNDSAKKSLSELCLDLQQNLDPKANVLYVLGLAGNEGSERQQWILSAKRAQAVARHLQQMLAPAGRTTSPSVGERRDWQVFWWGAGPGGSWAGQDAPVPEQSQILVAVLQNDT